MACCGQRVHGTVQTLDCFGFFGGGRALQRSSNECTLDRDLAVMQRLVNPSPHLAYPWVQG